MLVEWKKGQDKIKETLGEEYMDYNLGDGNSVWSASRDFFYS